MLKVNNKNILEVFGKARKKLKEMNVPEKYRQAVMSIYGVWTLHDEGLQIYREKAKFLNKKFSRFNRIGTKNYYKLSDKRTKGCKFLEKKFHQFSMDINSGKTKVNVKSLRII